MMDFDWERYMEKKATEMQEWNKRDVVGRVEPAQDDGWQVCPVCEGTGIVTGKVLRDYSTKDLNFNRVHACSTCEGRKIISKATGLPPFTHLKI